MPGPMDARLPAHIEATGLLRQVQAAGGFATVLHRGHREAGSLLVVLVENGAGARAYERMPQVDGARPWHLSKVQDDENKQEFSEYLARRAARDADLWIIELDIAHGERFIGLTALPG